MLTIGQTLQRFRIEALVGQGGMAAVYRVRHLQLDSDHALKVLFVTSPQVRERLLLEGKVQANLRHPNIVSVTDVLEVGGVPALVMEYVDGPTLDQWLDEHEPTLDEALWLFRGILRGVGAAHARGVVHRDLKPANVLLWPSSLGFVPKVTDFGLVKSLLVQESHSQTGTALGTPEYMSPEQIRDASSVDQRADMWALGCILYELVCGRRAFSCEDRLSTFEAIIEGRRTAATAYRDDLPLEVVQTIDGLLQLNPADRLPDAESVVQRLFTSDTPSVRGPRPTTDPAPLLVAMTRSSETHSGVGSSSSNGTPHIEHAPTGESAMRRAFGPNHRPSDRATAEFRLSPSLTRRSTYAAAAWWPIAAAAFGLIAVVVGALVVGPGLFPRHAPPRVPALSLPSHRPLPPLHTGADGGLEPLFDDDGVAAERSTVDEGL